MTDYAIGKIWDSLNEGEDLSESLKLPFITDCKEYGVLVAVFNLGWMTSADNARQKCK